MARGVVGSPAFPHSEACVAEKSSDLSWRSPWSLPPTRTHLYLRDTWSFPSNFCGSAAFLPKSESPRRESGGGGRAARFRAGMCPVPGRLGEVLGELPQPRCRRPRSQPLPFAPGFPLNPRVPGAGRGSGPSSGSEVLPDRLGAPGGSHVPRLAGSQGREPGPGEGPEGGAGSLGKS